MEKKEVWHDPCPGPSHLFPKMKKWKAREVMVAHIRQGNQELLTAIDIQVQWEHREPHAPDATLNPLSLIMEKIYTDFIILGWKHAKKLSWNMFSCRTSIENVKMGSSFLKI